MKGRNDVKGPETFSTTDYSRIVVNRNQVAKPDSEENDLDCIVLHGGRGDEGDDKNAPPLGRAGGEGRKTSKRLRRRLFVY